MSSILVWFGNFGEYLIPDRFVVVPFTKSGWPDKRYKLYREFMDWVKSVDMPN